MKTSKSGIKNAYIFSIALSSIALIIVTLVKMNNLILDTNIRLHLLVGFVIPSALATIAFIISVKETKKERVGQSLQESEDTQSKNGGRT